MTNLMVKLLLLLLAAILMSRAYIGWIKVNKSGKGGIIKIVLSVIFICFFIYVQLSETTMFEFLLGFSIILLLFAFRKGISKLFAKLCNSKLGKIKAVCIILLFPVGIWLALALFYRTPLGMPIGVKNYLYHKYDEEFEIAGFWAATPAGHPINEFTCWPKNGNKQTDSFNVVRKNTLSVGSRSFASDNYYGVFIRDDYENFVSELLAQYFEDFEVEVNFNWSGLSNTMYMSDELDKTFTLNQFLEFQKVNGESCNIANATVVLPSIYKENDKTQLLVSTIADNILMHTRYLIIDFVFTNDTLQMYKSGYIHLIINGIGEKEINMHI